MIKKILRTALHPGLTLGLAFLTGLTGCYRSQPEAPYASTPYAPGAQPVVAAAPTTVVLQDEYVYYPAYEVYYNSYRHNYVYRERDAWVTRPAPPGVSVDVLWASPSVRLDFRDAPERHHESVIRTYPRTWAPPGRGRGDRDDRKDERQDERKERR